MTLRNSWVLLVCLACFSEAEPIGAQAQFERHARRSYPIGPLGNVIVDLDRDGLLDIVFGGGGSLFFLAYQGMHSHFPVMITMASPFGFQIVHKPAIADLDGDGYLDMLVPTPGLLPSSIKDILLLGSANRNFTTASASHFTSPGRSQIGYELVDVDGDGDLDAACCVLSPPGGLSTNVIYVNDGKAHFGVNQQLASLPPNDESTYDMASGDFDGDGDPDLMVLNGGSTSYILTNDGKGHYHYHQNLGVINASWRVRTVDFDNDGDLDLCCTSLGGAQAWGPPYLFENDGKANFTDVSLRIPQHKWMHGVGWADIDDDGDMDMLMTSDPVQQPGGGYLALYQLINDGKGNFTDVTQTTMPLNLPFNYSVSDVEIGDLDNDGDLDFITHRGGIPWPSSVFVDIYWNMKRDLYPPRPAQIGKPWDLELHAPAGELLLLSASSQEGLLDLGQMGILQLDPSSMVSAPGFIMPASGEKTLTFQVPNAPLLVGQKLYWQAVTFDVKTSKVQLTNSFDETFVR